MLLPVHVVFLELIIDPACSIVFEAQPEEPDTMQRPPRRLNDPLFDRTLMTTSVLQGLGVLVIATAVFVLIMGIGQSELEARAASFTTLVIADLGLILSNRAWTQSFFKTFQQRNAALWWVSAGTAAFLLSALTIPSLRSLFRFAPLGTIELAIVFGAGLISIFMSEALKSRSFPRRSLYQGSALAHK